MSRSSIENKELFFATLAHDLKNPVQAQLLSLKMLADGSFGRLNSKQKEMLNIIVESTNYMQNMLETILNSYKLDNGVIFLNKSKFSLENLIQNCINEVRALAQSKNIKIHFDIQTSNVEILADSIQIRRVISNLLNNSLNYSFKNSELIISLLNNDNNIIFSLKNNSPEIPTDIKEHIFEKFISGSQTGTGLGLYFAKRIIEAHGGKIYLEANGTSNKFAFEISIK